MNLWIRVSFRRKKPFQKQRLFAAKVNGVASEIRKKLVDWGLEKYDAEAVVDQLKNEQYIDDKRYAQSFCP